MKLVEKGTQMEEERIEEPDSAEREDENAKYLATKVDELERKNEELLDKMKRLQADFDNYKKRMAKEHKEIMALASERLVRELLILLDDFERALTNLRNGADSVDQIAGLEIMLAQLKDILVREGVSEIETNCTLDPFQHEVVKKVEDSDHEDNEIIECLQKGYRMGNKVIRPARVIVCRTGVEDIERGGREEEEEIN